MTETEVRMQRYLGFYVDAKDERSTWCEAVVTHINRTTNMVRVHYVGFHERYNRWLALDDIAPFQTLSSRSDKPLVPNRPIWRGEASVMTGFNCYIHESTLKVPEKAKGKKRKTIDYSSNRSRPRKAKPSKATVEEAPAEEPSVHSPQECMISLSRSMGVTLALSPVASPAKATSALLSSPSKDVQASHAAFNSHEDPDKNPAEVQNAKPNATESTAPSTKRDKVVSKAGSPPRRATRSRAPHALPHNNKIPGAPAGIQESAGGIVPLVPDVVFQAMAPDARIALREKNLRHMTDASAFLAACIAEFHANITSA
ncbi:hypothetical protein SPRG_07010 [Saprolegnia parasitica CBS 223.65]|uniref:Tudor-knot domain-containing protein n=1 Tax=Saprolegnia parasitica (strain CBS 223.65) TaxID=695850 RepID=A0A067CKV1_SAPPC|nr:hypothetical protein SPRG_07010 [Saprolegnia parasitica CBS 223.65]KDO27422.1 hypothetical protein SPRG_07010 [Saprolegnia parasitica CBS 223.65]|eukprot:XP_012201862.1 hypothetical protein SPRG_07010 [Saprolegnia parasitica CBS 223.65]